VSDRAAGGRFKRAAERIHTISFDDGLSVVPLKPNPYRFVPGLITTDTLELLLLNQIAIRSVLKELSVCVSHPALSTEMKM